MYAAEQAWMEKLPASELWLMKAVFLSPDFTVLQGKVQLCMRQLQPPTPLLHSRGAPHSPDPLSWFFEEGALGWWELARDSSLDLCLPKRLARLSGALHLSCVSVCLDL